VCGLEIVDDEAELPRRREHDLHLGLPGEVHVERHAVEPRGRVHVTDAKTDKHEPRAHE